MMLPAEAFLPLVSDGWRKAWEALEGTDTGFLNEVIKTWQAAERHDELMVKDNQIALFISCEVRCALCQASVNSLTRNIPPSLLILLVKTGIWTSVQGLAYAKLLSEPEQQVKVLVELVPRLPDNLRLEVCLHALTIAEEMEDERDKAEALSKITPLLPGLIVIRVLNMARIMTYEECQVKVLMGVGQISHISPEILENALSIVSNINDEECRVKALAALSLKLSDELKSTLLHEALGIVRTIQNESYLVEVLCSLIPFLQDEFLEEALMAYTLLSSENNKIHLIKTIAPYAPEALQRKILEVVKDLKSDMGRIDVLFAIIPLLSGKLVLDVLPIINLFKDIKLQMDSVRDIIYLIYGKAIENAIKSQIDNLKDLGELFELARTILSDYDHLINKKLEQDFFLAKAIENARERVEAIAAQIPRLPENIKVEALKEAIKAAKSTKGKLRVELLTRLAPFLPQAQQLEILKEALRVTRVIDDVQGFSSIMQPIPSILMEETKIAREIPQVTDPFQKIQILEDEEQKLKMLIDSLPLLTEMQLPKLLRLIRMIEDEGYKTEIMLELIPTLPQALLPEVLKLVQRIEDEGCRTELLVRLTPLLPQSLIPVALGLAGTLSYSRDRIRVLAGLASILSEQQKVELLKEAKMLKDEGFRVEVLVKLNPFLALDMIRDSRDERLQARTLVEHLSKLPEISDALGKEALNIIKNMSHAKHQVEAIEGLVPYLSETLRVQIIEVMRSIEDERYRTQALIRLGLLTQLPQELQENAFTILRSMKNERYQAQALIDLVPQLSEALKTEVLVIVRSMKNERHQAQALIGLVPQLSEALKTEVLAIVRSMKNERYQAQALIGLVPQLSEALKTEVLATTVRSMKNERYQVETVVGLANFLAELPLVELYTIWSRVIHTLAHYTRQQFLLDLPHLSPIISTLGGTKAITEIDITVQEIRKWWP